MKVIVELELILDAPETDALDDGDIEQAFSAIARKPFYTLVPYMNVISYRKVEPWEKIDRLSSL